MLRSIIAAAGVTLALISTSLAAQSAFYHYAEHTPGFKKVAEGSRSYERGWYFDAYHDWLWAAYWADKTAQYNLGVMHYKGQHVERDPARAWAWFELAAEREYPIMVKTAAAVFEALNEAGQQRARAILNTLTAEYGDAVALERTQHFMNRERRRMTGSRVGFAPGMLRVVGLDGRTRDGQDYYDERRWNLSTVIAREAESFDAWSRARVEIGELELTDDEND
jgi:TPR repeat protein